MIGYDQTLLTMPPVMAQEFDFIRETDRITICGQVKCPSLSDYDHDGYDGEDADVILCLDRWGDLRCPA